MSEQNESSYAEATEDKGQQFSDENNSEIKGLEPEKSELELAQEKYARALADYQNLLKQTAKEKMEAIKFANQNLLYDLLPVYNNLKTALAHGEGETGAWLEGVRFVAKQFKTALADNGVEEIITAGVAYDHNTMEALSEEETSDEKLDGQVAKEAVGGYTLSGKVIMPAKVVVFKKTCNT